MAGALAHNVCVQIVATPPHPLPPLARSIPTPALLVST